MNAPANLAAVLPMPSARPSTTTRPKPPSGATLFSRWSPRRAPSAPASSSTNWRAWPARSAWAGQPELNTPYVNTIAVEEQPTFPGDLAIEERLASLMRWNALAMVVRANQAYRRTGRPHRQLRQRGRSVRDGLQPFLPRAQREPRRRPGVLSAAQRARRVRARFSRRAFERARPACTTGKSSRAPARGARGLSQLPAPVADARLLAVPHRLDGHRADQLDLPRALHALPHAPPVARLRRPQSVGRVRRRRDGRAREHERAHAGRARGAGQPGVGGQLQPAAAGRPGARQRPHHRRAGKAVCRRGLERHQTGLGQRLGRPVCPRPHRRADPRVCGHGGRPDADLRRQGRALQPRQLLRPERRARRAWRRA